MRIRLVLVLVLLGLAAFPVRAQESDAIVPDVIGLNVPQAAATLNAAGLVLGEQVAVFWAQESGLPQNSVSAQSIEVGASVPAGTAVSVTVLRGPNMRLIYTDTSQTLLNMSDSPADMSRLSFTDAASATSFMPARLINQLRPQGCLQLWSVTRSGPSRPDDCEFIQRWQVTSNPTEHFWRGANGVEELVVLAGGVGLVSCPASPAGNEANPLRCEFYYDGAGMGVDLTEYLYFVYTPEAIALINASEDRWMPTGANPIYNYNPSLAIPGSALRFGDPELWPDEFRRSPGEIGSLAPGQCLVMTSAPTDADASPEPCTVIAQRDLSPDVAFWLADFEIESVADDLRSVCPAAIAEMPTLCIVPR